jgi:GIY-YIG catalytic domain
VDIIRSLQERQYRWDELPSSDGPGVYAYYLSEPEALSPITVDRHQPLYVGLSEGSLDARSHFRHPHSGFSTFRRSLGAILKERLGLTAVPRAPGSSPTNTQNYRFALEGEQRLTAWMRQHLLYAHVPLKENVASAERELIGSLQPPLNLTGWRNPQNALIRDLRRRCAAEAQLSRAV